ncbi:MAG: PAS domain S-box protein [Phycisphaerae bacterium]|nr:PAS domain S-box protein [Phycisphaerae bacterium]
MTALSANQLDRQRFLQALEQLGPHEHLCLIYETQEEQFGAAIPFIRMGIERHEKCVYIADENSAETVLAAMRADGIAVDAATRSGALVLATRQETYLREGGFDPDRMMAFLAEATRTALSEGYTALRVTGEMTWVLAGDVGSGRLIEYEAKLNRLFPVEPCLAICQYNRWKFPANVIAGVIRTHPLVVYRETVCRNAYYIPPEESPGERGTECEIERLLNSIRDREAAEMELSRTRLELEERVAQRTAELREANQQLRHEIVNRTQVESALRDSNELLEAIFAQTHQAIAYLDVDLKLVRVNETFAEIGGHEPDSFVGRSLFDFFPDQQSAELFRRVAETGEPYAASASPYVFADHPERGTTYWDWTLTPIRNPTGKVVGLVLCVLDVTAHKLAELHLVDKERDVTALVSAPTDVAMLLDARGTILEANETICRRLGLERGKVVGACLWNLVAAPMAADWARWVEEVCRSGRPVRFEDDRQGIWYDNVLWPIREPSGQVVRVALLGRDITERRRVEMEIRRLSSFPQEDPSPVMELGPAGDITYQNPACGRYLVHLGLPLDQPELLLPTGFRDFVRQCLGEHRDVVVREQTVKDVTLSWSFHPLVGHDLVHAHGQDVTDRKLAERTLSKARDELERRVLARTADLEEANRLLRMEIAERRKVEEALEESQERYQVMLASVSSYRYAVDTRDGVAIRTEHGAGCAAVTGYTPGDYARDPHLWFTMVHPEDRPAVRDHINRLLSGEDVPPIEHRIIHRGGSVRWIRDTMVPHRDTEGRMVHYDGIVEDITERKQVEQEREATLSLLEATLESTGDGILVVDPNGRIRLANKRFLVLWGISAGSPPAQNLAAFLEHAGQEVSDPGAFLARMSEVNERSAQDNRGAVETVDGRVFECSCLPQYIGRRRAGWVWSFRDVTDRTRAEREVARHRANLEELVEKRTMELETSREQLVRAEQLASIGTLAAGIAHEINNPVGMMLLAAQAAMRYRSHPRGPELIEQSLNRIVSNARRCGQIVRGVLQFARQEPTEKWSASLNLAVTAACQAVSGYARDRDTALETDLAADLPNAIINPMQIEQVVVNLVKNAVEAAEAGGRVSIRTARGSLGARLVVQDWGRGMTDDQLKHLFDPFYTTRQHRGGTGLGLSIVHGIITEHGGLIAVDSRPGRGTTFTIDLPCAAVV